MALEPPAQETRGATGTCAPETACSGVFVEAVARLPAQAPGLDVFPEKRRGRVAIVAEALLEDLHDRHAGVEADQVGERQRAERMCEAEPRDRVDRLSLCDAFLQRPH